MNLTDQIWWLRTQVDHLTREMPKRAAAGLCTRQHARDRIAVAKATLKTVMDKAAEEAK